MLEPQSSVLTTSPSAPFHVTLIEYQIFAKNASFYYNIYGKDVKINMRSKFMAIFVDIKYSFIDLYNSIHKFLNRFFDDQFLGIVGIALIAIAFVTIFVKFTTSDKH